MARLSSPHTAGPTKKEKLPDKIISASTQKINK
jgi:hypothetical protein